MVRPHISQGPRFFANKGQPRVTGYQAAQPAGLMQDPTPLFRAGPPEDWAFRPSFNPYIPGNPSNRDLWTSTSGWRNDRRPVQPVEDPTPAVDANEIYKFGWITTHETHYAEQPFQVASDTFEFDTVSSATARDHSNANQFPEQLFGFGPSIFFTEPAPPNGHSFRSIVDGNDLFVARRSNFNLQVPQSALAILGTDRPEGFILRYLRKIVLSATERQQGRRIAQTHRLFLQREPQASSFTANPPPAADNDLTTHPGRTACRFADAQGPDQNAPLKCLTATCPGSLCACNITPAAGAAQVPAASAWPLNWVQADLVKVEAVINEQSSQPVVSAVNVLPTVPTVPHAQSSQQMQGRTCPTAFFRPIRDEPRCYPKNFAPVTAVFLRGAIKYKFIGDFITELIQFKRSLNLDYCRHLELSLQHCRSECSRLRNRALRTERSVRNGTMPSVKQNEIIARGSDSDFLVDCARLWAWTEQQRSTIIAWDNAKGHYRCDCCKNGRSKTAV